MKAIGMVTVKSAYNTFKGNDRKSMPLAELQEICLPKRPPKQGWTFYGNGKVIKECFSNGRS